MDVKKLYTEVASSVVNGQLIVSTDTQDVFSAVCPEMMAIFQQIDPAMDAFTIDRVILNYDDDQDFFSISSESLCEISIGFSFSNLFFSPSGLELVCKICNRSLDFNGQFMLSECLQTFGAVYCSETVTDKISGILQFGSILLPLSGILDANGRREYFLKENEISDINALLPSAFSALSISSFLPPDIPIHLSGVTVVFEENTNPPNIMSNDSFAIELQTDCNLGIDNLFHLSSLAFYFERFGSEYALGIEGQVCLLTLAPLKFSARYENEGLYTFGLCSADSPAFGFEHIAQLTGVNAKDAFPDELASSTGFTLANLTVTTDFSKIQSFAIEIGCADKWIFCANPQLALSDVKLSFALSDLEKRYGISGVVTLFGKDVLLAAAYSSSAGWIFHGALSPYQSISMSEIANGIAELFGVSSFTIPLDIEISNFSVTVSLSGDFSFSGMILAGTSTDDTISTLFNGKCTFAVTGKHTQNGHALEASAEGSVNICGNKFTVAYQHNEQHIISAQFAAKDKDELSLASLLLLFGDDELAQSLPDFLNFSLLQVSLQYDFTLAEHKTLSFSAQFNDFEVSAVFAFGETFDYTVNVTINSVLDLAKIPVAGDILRGLNTDTCISSPRLSFSKANGLVFSCSICKDVFTCTLIPPKKHSVSAYALTTSDSASTKWIGIHKSISVFQLHRLGISMSGNTLDLLVDASLSISPLTFDLLGVGIGADIPKFESVHFLLQGFGVSFSNGTVNVSGAFSHNEDSYQGELSVTAGNFSILAMGEYRKNSLMAYALLSYPLGGPPCFFITGIAAAFGYNKRLTLPDIADVQRYPLVAAAVGTSDKAKLITDLNTYITDCSGSHFLAAGVKFTSFEIVDGFAMLTVSFGHSSEIGLLGLAQITMPPKCTKTPIAKAELAIKAAVLPASGLVSCEAMLTPDSFVFSEKCRLTGGFALYMWFNGPHKGDFVITLGGYHPAYKKPEHYPVVPRLGFRWDVLPKPNRLVISGELYFSLTPSAIMAGGKLSAVYTDGNLKAYFIAYADFLLQWKPFYYDIRIGIALGASYRVDFWFVHHTFSIELSADLHIWGPNFSGIAHISWFIISFSIPFGDNAPPNAPPLAWTDFRDSFIPQNTKKTLKADNEDAINNGANPLSIKLFGEISENIVRADDFSAVIDTVIPVKTIDISDNTAITAHTDHVHIQPMNGTLTASALSVKLVRHSAEYDTEQIIPIEYSVTHANVPSALWGQKGDEQQLIEDIPAGISMSLPEYIPELFPETGEINEDVLTEAQKTVISDAFIPVQTPSEQHYTHTDTIKTFIETAVSASDEGTELLQALGFNGTVSSTQLAEDADNLFDDDILIGSVII